MSNGDNAAVQTSLYGFSFREPDLRRNEDRQTHDIKQLWQRSHEILNLALLGYKQTEIAETLGIHPQTVSNTLNSSLGKETLARKRKTRDQRFEGLNDEILELTEKAMKVYNEIITDPAESRKLKKETADTICLEMAGLRAPTRIDSRSMQITASAKEIAEFKRRGLQAAVDSGLLNSGPSEAKAVVGVPIDGDSDSDTECATFKSVMGQSDLDEGESEEESDN